VQSAAQDEMAFEQRATVTENLENFVLGHGGSVKFQVSSFKPDYRSVGAMRRSVRATDSTRHPRFLLASEF
jgi:hypothetical protein